MLKIYSFNTEDGIGRATTKNLIISAITCLSFNTEDGIGRATTIGRSGKVQKNGVFQYRRRYREGYNYKEIKSYDEAMRRFNTEDGIGRATTPVYGRSKA